MKFNKCSPLVLGVGAVMFGVALSRPAAAQSFYPTDATISTNLGYDGTDVVTGFANFLDFNASPRHNSTSPTINVTENGIANNLKAYNHSTVNFTAILRQNLVANDDSTINCTGGA